MPRHPSASCRCETNRHTLGGFKRAHLFSLSSGGLESRGRLSGPKARCRPGHAPSGPGGGRSLASARFSGCCHSLPCSCDDRAIFTAPEAPPCASGLALPLSTAVMVFGTHLGNRGSSGDLRFLITSAKTLFPNKEAFTDSRDYVFGPDVLVGGGSAYPQIIWLIAAPAPPTHTHPPKFEDSAVRVSGERLQGMTKP